jgi:RHS repeat-associated protein
VTASPRGTVRHSHPRTHTPLGCLQLSGYRYYNPELGRWPSRDPIGEGGGLNLFGFAGNDAVGLTDVLGRLVRTFFDPDPVDSCPYAMKDLSPYYGLTTCSADDGGMLEVNCFCECPDEDGYRITCHVYLHCKIILDTGWRATDGSWVVRWVGGNNTGLPGHHMTHKQAYGHEQAHVKSLQHAVNTVLVPLLTRLTSGTIPTPGKCNEWAARYEAYGQTRLDRILHDESHSTTPNNANTPVDGANVPPTGTMPDNPI